MTRLFLFNVCLVLAVMLPSLSVGQDVEWPETSDVIDVLQTNSKVEMAKLEAIESLPRFLTKLENPPRGWSDFSFKVDFPHGEDASEFMWVAFLERKNGIFEGLLANDPKYVDYVSFGDLVEFEKSQIIDWQYSSGGKLHGHYTTRALLDEMAPKAKTQMLAILSETPE